MYIYTRIFLSILSHIRKPPGMANTPPSNRICGFQGPPGALSGPSPGAPEVPGAFFGPPADFPRRSKRARNRRKIAPRRPRWPQDASKTPQDGPKTVQDASKTPQEASKRPPKRAPRSTNHCFSICFSKFLRFSQFGLPDAPRPPKRPPKIAPRRPKRRPRRPPNSPRGPRDSPRGLHDGRRDPQDGSKRGPQEAP